MALTRAERIMIHKKQESGIISEGDPLVLELSEGVPVFRLTNEGLVQYIRHNGVLYKSVFKEDIEDVHKKWNEI